MTQLPYDRPSDPAKRQSAAMTDGVDLSTKEAERRLATWLPPDSRYVGGVMGRCRRTGGPASEGAVLNARADPTKRQVASRRDHSWSSTPARSPSITTNWPGSDFGQRKDDTSSDRHRTENEYKTVVLDTARVTAWRAIDIGLHRAPGSALRSPTTRPASTKAR